MRYLGTYQQFYIFKDLDVYRAIDEAGNTLTADSMSGLRGKIDLNRHKNL